MRPEPLTAELDGYGLIVRDMAGERLVTNAEVLAEERQMLVFARDGRGRCRPLAVEVSTFDGSRLSDEQQAVVRQVLTSPDRVMLVRGVAGTGKTTLLTECVNAVQRVGVNVVILAPSADASRGVLRAEGFSEADTVARFLIDDKFQEQARGNLIWVDEAGLLGSRDVASLFRVADALGTRVVLVGDRHQHHSVARGSVLRLLETEAGLATTEVKTIRRQSGRYRDAVRLLSQGQAAAGLDVLDDLGWVREVADADRTRELVSEYLSTVRAGKSVLVVAPTHAEGRAVTAALRAALRTDGSIRGDEQTALRLESRDLTIAERGWAVAYRPGDVVEFHQKATGFRAGERFTVAHVGRSSVGVVNASGRPVVLPLRLADRFQVYTPQTVSLAVGDRLRITKNARAANSGKRLDNGSLHSVEGFTADGGVRLNSGAVLPATFGHLAHGYVLTSHASQGKTVDRVLIAESSLSFRVASREQWYVSVSRGRERATVFTDDKAALRRTVERSDPRPMATELMAAGVPPAPIWRAWVARRVRSVRRWVSQAAETVRERVEGRDESRRVGR